MAAQINEDKPETHWHLEKTVSVGHIITTLAAVGSVVVWGLNVDKRVTVLEAQAVYSHQSMDQMDKNWRESMSEVKSALIRIEAKIDSKADKR
jgi:hypothetical protein